MSGSRGRGGGQRQRWQGRVSGVHWSPPSAPRASLQSRGQCVRREAAAVAPEQRASLSSGACLLRWPERLQEYSWLRSSASPSPQTVSSQPTAVSFRDLRSKSLFPHPALRTLADTHLRLGCPGLWPGPPVWVSLCPACRCVAAALSLEPPSFPSAPADGPAGEGLPQI